MKLHINDVMETMKKDRKFLYSDTIPVGTKITGIYDKRYGREVDIEKQSWYETAWGVDGRVGRIQHTEWTISGRKEFYMRDRLEKMIANTEYYEVRR